MPDTLEKVATDLKSSPLFNLSLASKELFHSNFLAWLAEKYADLFARLLSGWLNEETTPRILTVEREKNHFDLTIEREGAYDVVIENKVKSIPYTHQLDEYARALGKKRGSTKCILLSLTTPAFCQDGKYVCEKDGVAWHLVTYEALAADLRRLASDDATITPYHRELIEDYCTFVDGLVRVGKHSDIVWESDVYDFYCSRLQENLQRARLHDLFVKRKHMMMADRLEEQIIASLPDIKSVVRAREHHVPQGFLVGSGMSHTLGMTEWQYRIYGSPTSMHRVQVGVQIQGTGFGLLVEAHRDHAREIAERLFNEKLWFDFGLIGGKKKERKDGEPYYQYKSKERLFLYQCVEIPNETRIADVIDWATEYATLVVERHDQLFSLLQLHGLLQHE